MKEASSARITDVVYSGTGVADGIGVLVAVAFAVGVEVGDAGFAVGAAVIITGDAVIITGGSV